MRHISSTILRILLLIGFFALPAIAFAGVISMPVNNLGLVGYWSFENSQGSVVAADNTGSGNDGTLVNMDSGTDYVDGYRSGSTALDFDGVNDYVDISTNPDADLDSFTIAAWVKTNNTTKTPQYIYSITDETGPDFNRAGFVLVYNNNGNNRFYFDIFPGSTNEKKVYSSVYNDTNWHFVVAKWSNGSTYPSIYIDGVLDDAVQSSNTADATIEYPVGYTPRIAKSSDPANSSDTYFSGYIDDVRQYSRALSAAEIQKIYAGTFATYKQSSNGNLVGYWSFEDATGTQATDFSGNGNTGTLTNMANDDWVNGRVGKALDFDGVNDYVTTGSIFPIPANISVFAWVKPDVQDVNDYIISDTGASKFGLALSDESGKKIKAFLGSGPTIYTETYTATLGQWQHIGYTYSGSALQFYVNGVALGSPQSTSPSLSGTATIEIARLSLASAYFNGQIDEVRVYSDDLTASQVLALYNNSKSTKVNSSQNSKLTDGLVGLWSFNGSDIDWANNRAIDGSGNGNDGVITNMSSITAPTFGVNGQALDFDGINDYVQIPHNADFESSTLSYVVWLYYDQDTFNDFDMILTKANGGGGGTSAGELRVTLNNQSTTNIAFLGNGGGGATTTAAPLTVRKWHHVVATATSGTSAQIYVDGVAVNTSGTPTFTATGRPLYIANRDDDYTGKWPGMIDEVRVYNRILTQEEVTRLYNLGR